MSVNMTNSSHTSCRTAADELLYLLARDSRVAGGASMKTLFLTAARAQADYSVDSQTWLVCHAHMYITCVAFVKLFQLNLQKTQFVKI